MKFLPALAEHEKPVFRLVQDTIRSIYPNYYLPEIVDFFASLHSQEAISRDIAAGRVYVLLDGPRLAGTGTLRENHITRVFAAPDFLGKGVGHLIMEPLEGIIFENYDTAYLDASLPAGRFYDRRGYRTVRHEKWPVENGRILVYEVMEKTKIT